MARKMFVYTDLPHGCLVACAVVAAEDRRQAAALLGDATGESTWDFLHAEGIREYDLSGDVMPHVVTWTAA